VCVVLRVPTDSDKDALFALGQARYAEDEVYETKAHATPQRVLLVQASECLGSACITQGWFLAVVEAAIDSPRRSKTLRGHRHKQSVLSSHTELCLKLWVCLAVALSIRSANQPST
jgi:hypothetical protein